jgi:multidrug resistance protein MdtO
MLVVRMVTAATFVMIMTMSFQMPYGAYGAIYAFAILRESLRMTVLAVRTIVMPSRWGLPMS